MSLRLPRPASYRRWGGFAPLALVLLVLLLLPVVMLVYASLVDAVPRPGNTGGRLTLQWYRELVSPGFGIALRNTVLLAAASTVLAVLVGGGLAWLAARTDIPAKRVIQVAGIVPLFLPTLVGALAWSFLASPRQGFLNIILRDLGISLNLNVYSLPGMVFVFGLYYAPYAYLVIFSAFSLSNPELEEAAEVSGASTGRTLRLVTFPLVTPAVLGSALLVLAMAVENFPVPQILGSPAGVTTLPSYLYRLMHTTPPSANLAAAIGVVMVAIIAVILLVQRRYLTTRDYTTVTGKGLRPRVTRLGGWRWPAFAAVLGYLMLAVVLPLLALLEMALRDQPYVAGAADLVDPGQLGTKYFDRVLEAPSFQLAFKNTGIVAVAVALLGVLLAGVMAVVVYRSRLPGRAAVEYAAWTPLAVPPLVMGMCMLWVWFLLPVPLYGTLMIIILAFIVRFLPQAYNAISASLRQVHRDLEESALVCGASRVRVAAEVTVPLLRSSVVSAALLLLILSFHEVSVAIFIFTSETNVVSVAVFGFWESGSSAAAAAACLVYSAVLLVVVICVRRWLSGKEIEVV